MSARGASSAELRFRASRGAERVDDKARSDAKPWVDWY